MSNVKGCRKLHENERIWTGSGGSGGRSATKMLLYIPKELKKFHKFNKFQNRKKLTGLFTPNKRENHQRNFPLSLLCPPPLNAIGPDSLVTLTSRLEDLGGERHVRLSSLKKVIDFTSPRTSSGQASWPYETVPIQTILSPSEGGRKPEGENHQALAVKGERHPHMQPRVGVEPRP